MKYNLLDQPRINFIFRFTYMHKRSISFAVTEPIRNKAISLLRKGWQVLTAP